MKKLLLILAATVLSQTFLPATNEGAGDPIKIVIYPKPGQPITRSEIVECWYDETAGVVAEFHTDLGQGEVRVISGSSGLEYQNTGDTADGSITVTLPETTGYFDVLITTSSGLEYDGAFVL